MQSIWRVERDSVRAVMRVRANARAGRSGKEAFVCGDRDWRRAVDYYLSQHSATSGGPDTPAWLRESGAIYAAVGGGLGGIYLYLPGVGTATTDYASGGGAGCNSAADLKKSGFTCVLGRMLFRPVPHIPSPDRNTP